MAALVSVPRPSLLHHFRHLASPFLHLLRAFPPKLLTPLLPNPEPLLRLSSRDTSSPFLHFLKALKTPKLPTPILSNPEPLLGLSSRDTSPSLLHVKASASSPTRSPLLTESTRSDDVARASKSPETKPTMFSSAMNFSWNKKIIWLVLLWFIFSSTAGAEARAYPGSESGGSQGQGANATTSFGLDDPIFAGLAAECSVTAVFEKMKGDYDPKLLYMCGSPCCGKKYRGPCCRCCSKGNGHTSELPMNDVDKAGSGGDGTHGRDNGHN